jgi:hypothetical protein
LLPDPALKAVYEKATWLYVYRDFSGSEADRRAERVLLRFGVSSWPQHFLVDPNTWETLADTGRSVATFLPAVEGARVEKTRSPEANTKLREAEARAVALEENGTVALARKGIDDEDCRILKEQADPDSAPALAALAKEPKGSRNPNVLRIRAVEALGACGGPREVETIAPFAQSGEYFNGLTGISIDALLAIADRHPKSKSAVRAALKQGYPTPPADGEPRATAACTALTNKIEKALEKLSR